DQDDHPPGPQLGQGLLDRAEIFVRVGHRVPPLGRVILANPPPRAKHGCPARAPARRRPNRGGSIPVAARAFLGFSRRGDRKPRRSAGQMEAASLVFSQGAPLRGCPQTAACRLTPPRPVATLRSPDDQRWRALAPGGSLPTDPGPRTALLPRPNALPGLAFR